MTVLAREQSVLPRERELLPGEPAHPTASLSVRGGEPSMRSREDGHPTAREGHAGGGDDVPPREGGALAATHGHCGRERGAALHAGAHGARLIGQSLPRQRARRLAPHDREARRAPPSRPPLRAPLVRAVHRKNADLGEKLARAVGTSVVALGLVPATPEQRRAARGGSVAWLDEVFAVLQAAAGAGGLTLEEARSAVAAAVATAADMGLTLEQLDPVLNPRKPGRR